MCRGVGGGVGEGVVVKERIYEGGGGSELSHTLDTHTHTRTHRGGDEIEKKERERGSLRDSYTHTHTTNTQKGRRGGG